MSMTPLSELEHVPRKSSYVLDSQILLQFTNDFTKKTWIDLLITYNNMKFSTVLGTFALSTLEAYRAYASPLET
ncbi:hypothetical protein E4U52_004119 [Claviceps spartinae]|nr:hypothetical protein E4U52_004119 [Claviceps spartinae]